MRPALFSATGALLALVLGGCDSDARVPAPSLVDMAIADYGSSDGPPPLRGAFTVSGCEQLSVVDGQPRCSGHAPLELTFVPLTSGVDTYLWTFDGGDPPSSMAISPSVRFAAPGSYAVTLAAGGPAGQSSADGVVTVVAGGLGAACGGDGDCAAGLGCLCQPGDSGCRGGLGAGVCTRACPRDGCGDGALCADLTRGGVYAANGSGPGGEVWRRVLCLPSCQRDQDCRPGLVCRALPVSTSGPGGSGWQRGCFADFPADVGAACRAGDGTLDGSRCLSGRCEAYGARGLCTASCASSGDCPDYAGCATFANDARPRCLARCAADRACDGDPLLDCEAAGQGGAYGFTVSPAETATFCAPRRCQGAADCAPAGSCVAGSGGSYCVANP